MGQGKIYKNAWDTLAQNEIIGSRIRAAVMNIGSVSVQGIEEMLDSANGWADSMPNDDGHKRRQRIMKHVLAIAKEIDGTE